MSYKSKFAFTVSRPVAITMIVIGIAVFGFISYFKLSWSLMPDISYPSFTIRTEYAGAAPEEVENVVSRPLEEQLSLIKDLISITSISRPEQSDIILEFDWDVNLDRAASEIREKLDQVYLDPDVERPMILRYDPSLDPVIRIGISGDMPLTKLRTLAEEDIVRDLESIPGVAAAKVKGGLEEEILVKVDENKLVSANISISQISNRLASENINLAGGNVKEGNTEYIIRILNEFKTVKEIGEIIITKKNGIPIKLKDIATIERSHKEREVITRANGKETIEISIYKEADANIVDVCEKVKAKIYGTPQQQAFVKNMDKKQTAKIKDRRAQFREAMLRRSMTDFLVYKMKNKVKFVTLADQSIFIKNSINEVKSTAIWGGILAIIILYLFLNNFGTTLIVALSIPLSIIATFAPLKLFNVSLNIMSLGGLALGIGMLVDNSIVVMESIFRCREEGDDWISSAVRGVSEVGGAVIASTLTTVSVFFPIVFVEGIAGQIFGDLSLAVVFSLIASLLVALFFIPMLASRKLNKNELDFQKIGSSFRFKVEMNKSFGNLLLSPIDLVFFILIQIKMSIFYCLFLIVQFLHALLLPILKLVKLDDKLFNFIKVFSRKQNDSKYVLWEEFFQLKNSELFIDNFKLYKYPYYLFRFILQSFMFFINRIVLIFVSILFFIGKFFVIISVAIFSPLFKILSKIFNIFITKVYNFYPILLAKALKNDVKVIVGVLLLFFITIFGIWPFLGKELIPEVHQGTFYLNVKMPVGTPVEKTDSVLNVISNKIIKIKDVKDVNYYAGTTKDDITSGEIGEHVGRITVNVRKNGDIKRIEEKILGQIRSFLVDFTDIDYNISRPVLFTMKPPIQLEIKGFNIEELRKIADDIANQMKKLPMLKDIESSIKYGYPEIVISFNRELLSQFGLNTSDVATLIENKIKGNVATRFKEEDRRIDIRVYLKDNQRLDATHLKDLIVNPGGNIPIPLRSVATLKIVNGPSEIRRINQERTAVITANIEGVNLTEATSAIYDILSHYDFPENFTYDISGQNKEMETSLNSLFLALVLAILLVYIVMASQFESFLHPFLILFTIPMALIGVVLTLFVFNIAIGITVFIGLITLAGIVVNNAIVLIDYINLLRSKGMDKIEAIKKAGFVRLRPILITSFTTILGLLPMALGLGEGAEIRTPMAITIIAGLASSTFLTLVLIPVVYKRFSK